MTAMVRFPSGGPSAPGRRSFDDFFRRALLGYPSPPSPINARKLAENGSPRGGRVATQKFARCTFQLSRQNTTDNRLRDMLLSRRTHTHTQLKSEHDKVHSQLRLRPPLLERSLPFLRVGARRCSASMTASDGRAPSTRPWRRKPLWGRCLACGERALHTAAQALAQAII